MANENSAKSPIKTVAVSALPVKSPRKSPASKNAASENNGQDNKENGELETYNVRSKLHRLGKLYSGKQYLKIKMGILYRILSKSPSFLGRSRCLNITLNLFIWSLPHNSYRALPHKLLQNLFLTLTHEYAILNTYTVHMHI